MVISSFSFLDMNVYFEMMQKSQRALKHSASSLFTVSSFYKEITELFNHIENSEAEVKKDEIEKLMDIVEDFIESKEYNTDILETWIRDNEEFLIKYENLFGLSLRNESIEGTIYNFISSIFKYKIICWYYLNFLK